MIVKSKIMLARFPGNFQEHPKSSNYLRKIFGQMRPIEQLGRSESDVGCTETWRCAHEDFSEVVLWDFTDTPIDMVRNRCVDEALQMGCDYILMIDSDMWPDQPRPGAQPFWDVAWGFLRRRQRPAKSILTCTTPQGQARQSKSMEYGRCDSEWCSIGADAIRSECFCKRRQFGRCPLFLGRIRHQRVNM